MGFTKTRSTSSHSERSFKVYNNYEEKHSKNLSQNPHHGNAIKKQDISCPPKLNKTEAAVKSEKLPPRPSTRRHPYEMPLTMQGKSRSQPVVALRKRNTSTGRKPQTSTTIKKDTTEIPAMSPPSTSSSCKSNNNKYRSELECERKDMEVPQDTDRSSSRVEQHEYLHFLLRITEDIIVNNYYRNEDIEKVFETHMKTNKNRLSLDKMEDHIAELASELNIPYQNRGGKNKNDSSTPLVVPTLSFSFSPPINCFECSANRTLDFHKNLEDFEDILFNRRSLGRVTECTEPSTSLDTILNAKYASRATLSSMGCETVSSCGLGGVAKSVAGGSDLVKRVSANGGGWSGSRIEDIPLTDKEKKVSDEEKVFFDKLIENTTVESFEQKSKPVAEVEQTENVSEHSNSISKSTIKVKTCDNKSIQTIEAKVSTRNIDIQADMSQQKQQTDDKCTQIHVTHCDRECGTTSEGALEDVHNEEEYVLIDVPVYVLKKTLEKQRKFTVAEHEPPPVALPVTPSKHDNDQINNKSPILSDYVVDSDAIYPTPVDYSKLLGTEYDLTPERDHPTTDKYHHLLVDASTSFTNVDGGTCEMRNSLLLTEKYVAPDVDEAVCEDKTPHSLDYYYLSSSEVSQDEFKSYAGLPKRNETVKSLSCSESRSVSDNSFVLERRPAKQVGERIGNSTISPLSSVRSRDFSVGEIVSRIAGKSSNF